MNYPTEFPAAEIGRIISSLRDGFQKEDVPQLLHSAWLIEGWAFGAMAGDPSGPIMRAALNGGDSVARLTELLVLCGEDEVKMEGPLTDQLIKMLIDHLIMVLRELIDGWLSA